MRANDCDAADDDAWFYQLYFQKPGVAEVELERDVRLTIRSFLYPPPGTLDGGQASRSARCRETAAFSATRPTPRPSPRG